MKKMTVLYKMPPDLDAFMAYYQENHLPLVMKIPGLAKLEVTKVNRTMMSEQPYALIAEMSFADDESFRTAMKSPENAATGADLANFAAGLAIVMMGEAVEF
jgi:uncharacterized protein (TIGR02118 family)